MNNKLKKLLKRSSQITKQAVLQALQQNVSVDRILICNPEYINISNKINSFENKKVCLN